MTATGNRIIALAMAVLVALGIAWPAGLALPDRAHADELQAAPLVTSSGSLTAGLPSEISASSIVSGEPTPLPSRLSLGVGETANLPRVSAWLDLKDSSGIPVPASVTTPTWKSANSKVARVVGDKVQAVKKGATKLYTDVEVAGKSKHLTVPVTVVGKDIASAVVSVVGSGFTFTGKALKPKVTVKLDGVTLRPGTDFTLTYKNNVKAGTATITITGKGAYSGKKTTTFTIGRRSLSGARVTLLPRTFTYDGKAKTPKVTVTLAGQTLKAGTDYTITWPKDRVKAGSKAVVIRGKGNYFGMKTATYVVNPAKSSSSSSSSASAGKGSGSAAGKSGSSSTARVASQPMYRLYNPYTGEHLYTASAAERDNLTPLGWRYEGIGWNAPVKSNSPVYRMYNPYSGDHHYTIDAKERDWLRYDIGWRYEGIGWYSDDAKGVPLYRQFNPNEQIGTHNYTMSKAENDFLVSIGWRAEGIGWYGVK